MLLAACGSAPTRLADEPVSAGTAEASAPAVPPEAQQQFDRALSLLGSGELAKAQQELQSLSEAFPQYAGPPLNLGIVHLKAGRLPEAEQAFKVALERNPVNAATFNQLGIVYRRQGRFKEADQAYQQALQVDPNHALAHLNLGVLCDLYLQQPERALAEYERYLALTAEPDPSVVTWVKELRARLGGGAGGSGGTGEVSAAEERAAKVGS